MDRLTDRTRNHGIYLTGQNMGATGYVPDNVLKRLAAYEDTGLTPEEITANKEMFAAYRHVCGGKSPDEVTQMSAENARLRAERDKAVEDLAQDAHCMLCKHHRSEGGDCIGMSMCAAQGRRVGWQWRGTEGKA